MKMLRPVAVWIREVGRGPLVQLLQLPTLPPECKNSSNSTTVRRFPEEHQEIYQGVDKAGVGLINDIIDQ